MKLELDYGTSTQNNGSLREQTITVPTVGATSGFTAVQTYAYDGLNRLQSAAESVASAQTWKQTFSYDRYGNRRFNTTSGNTTTLGSCPEVVCNPAIDTSDNRFVTDQNSDSVDDYAYDKNGNLTLDAEGRTFSYDAENHQTEVKDDQSNTIGEYLYDGEGRRVKKITDAETTVFVYNAGGRLVAEYSTATAQEPRVSYLTTDHLGSPRVVTDENGAVIDRKDYTAFGEENYTPERVAGLGYSAADELRKGYTGYEKDGESGLDFAQARYYKATHGRFTSLDPLTASASIRNPQTFNRYSYVLNSPYKFTDPLGLLAEDPKSRPKTITKTDMVNEMWLNDILEGLGYWVKRPTKPTTPEPVRDQAGTIAKFIQAMNNSPSKIGKAKKAKAGSELKRLGITDLTMQPVTTPYFNKNKNRYVYTENGGWIDMVHFLFYAGKAYSSKGNGAEHPIGQAMQMGYWQERLDGEHSSYSYEDLPSDKFGADFAVNHFSETSDKTLGEQIQAYFVNTLKATDPENAPNWDRVPATDDGKSKPTEINKTTTPFFVGEN